ncbi:MAG: type II secretion system protein GspN [Deltaproteobacteria bacterium]|nr:type II secretion system protein GspN [Deltaproteobacteria bacterium]
MSEWTKKIFVVGGLLCYAVILFFFMIFYRLPADKLIAATVDDASKGRMIFKAEKMNPAFPLLYKFLNVEYGFSTKDVVVKDRFKSMTLSPDYGRLLGGYMPVRFHGVFNRGHMHGRMGVSLFRGAEDGYVTVTFSDIRLEDLNIVTALTDRSVKGVLNGAINIKGNMNQIKAMEGKGAVTLQKASIGTTMAIPGIKSVPFETIRLSFTLKEGVLNLKDSRMEGPMFSGDISGVVHMHKKMEKSTLNVLARMKVGSLPAGNKTAGKLFSKILKKGGRFTVKITGPVAAPSISWSRG